MVKNLQCLKTLQICYLRHAEHHAENRTSLCGLDHDTLFLNDPLFVKVLPTNRISLKFNSCVRDGRSDTPFYKDALKSNKAGYTAQNAPSTRLKKTGGARTDGRTDTTSYRDATAQLKTVI